MLSNESHNQDHIINTLFCFGSNKLYKWFCTHKIINTHLCMQGLRAKRSRISEESAYRELQRPRLGQHGLGLCKARHSERGADGCNREVVAQYTVDRFACVMCHWLDDCVHGLDRFACVKNWSKWFEHVCKQNIPPHWDLKRAHGEEY